MVGGMEAEVGGQDLGDGTLLYPNLRRTGEGAAEFEDGGLAERLKSPAYASLSNLHLPKARPQPPAFVDVQFAPTSMR